MYCCCYLFEKLAKENERKADLKKYGFPEPHVPDTSRKEDYIRHSR
jgi:hypothetical protein